MVNINKNNQIYFLIVIAFFLFVFSLNNRDIDNLKYFRIADISLEIEVVSAPEALTRGLSGRNDLADNEGMLFVFNNIGKHSFWMKDMNFPIDIIWIDENLKVVYIKKDARPESYPEVFSPDQDSKYVLEVVAGFSDKNNIKIGDKIESSFLK